MGRRGTRPGTKWEPKSRSVSRNQIEKRWAIAERWLDHYPQEHVDVPPCVMRAWNAVVDNYNGRAYRKDDRDWEKQEGHEN